MISPDWKAFAQKHSGCEREAFEWLCYLLFCRRYGLSEGLARYVNNPAIETEPVRFQGDVIGWQAKYYDEPLSRKTAAVLKTIREAKSCYPALSKLVFFCNRDFGSGKRDSYGVHDPACKARAEELADSLGIELEWFLASQFESPFVAIDNADIAEHFFSPHDCGIIGFARQLAENGRRYFDRVETSVRVGEGVVEIDRGALVSDIARSDDRARPLIIVGESGVGKTAAIKMFREALDGDAAFLAVDCRNASLWMGEMDPLGTMPGKVLADVQSVFSGTSEKFILFDSAERFDEARSPMTTAPIMRFARDGGWRVLLTVRPHALCFVSELLTASGFDQPEILEVAGFDDERLREMLELSSAPIDLSSSLAEMFRRPVYAKYLDKVEIAGVGDEGEFRSAVFEEVLLGYPDALARSVRRDALFAIAERRLPGCRGGHVLDSAAMASLVREGIAVEGAGVRAPGFSHDFIEELVVDRLFDAYYADSVSQEGFLSSLGGSLAARRPFREWLIRRSETNPAIMADFAKRAFSGAEMPVPWQDEVMVAMLLSGDSGSILEMLCDRFLLDDWTLFRRLARLLRTACKEVDDDLVNLMREGDMGDAAWLLQRPMGLGWGACIEFAYRFRGSIPMEGLGDILPMLEDWTAKHERGPETRMSGLIALDLNVRMASLREGRPSYGDWKTVAGIVANSAMEIKQELGGLIESLEARWDEPYMLNSPIAERLQGQLHEARYIAEAAPAELSSFLKRAWLKAPRESIEPFAAVDALREGFGLDFGCRPFYPPSAWQTPVYMLLRVGSREGLDLVLSMANHAVRVMADSEFSGECLEIAIPLPDGNTAQMTASFRLWASHLGLSVVPDLYASVMMAFEKWLLELADGADPETLERACFGLLRQTKSASIASIVAGAAMAHPEKCFNIICAFLSCKEAMALDRERVSKWSGRLVLPFFSSDFAHEKDRRESDALPFRESSLELVALQYQVTGGEEKAGRIHEIIDGQMSVLGDDGDSLHYRVLYSRADSRNMKPAVVDVGGKSVSTLRVEIPRDLLSGYMSEAALEEQRRLEEVSRCYLRAERWWNDESDLDGEMKSAEAVMADFAFARDVQGGFAPAAWAACSLAAVAIRDCWDVLTPENLQRCTSFVVDSLLPLLDDPRMAANVLGTLLAACVIAAFKGDERSAAVVVSILVDPWQRYATQACRLVALYGKSNLGFACSLAIGLLLSEEAEREFGSHGFTQGPFFERRSMLECAEAVEASCPDVVAGMMESTLDEGLLGDLTSYRPVRLARAFVMLSGELPGNGDDMVSCLKLMAEGFSSCEAYEVDMELVRSFCEVFAMCALDGDGGFGKVHVRALAPLLCSRPCGRTLLHQTIDALFVLDADRALFKSLWTDYLNVAASWSQSDSRHALSDDIVPALLFVDSPYTNEQIRSLLLDGDWQGFFDRASMNLRGPRALFAFAYLIDEIVPEWVGLGLTWVAEVIGLGDGGKWGKVEQDTVFHLERVVLKASSTLGDTLDADGPLKAKYVMILDFLIDQSSSVAFTLRDRIS